MPLMRKAIKRLYYPIDIIAQCVRGYLDYALSLRNLEKMMAERGVIVDYSTRHAFISQGYPSSRQTREDDIDKSGAKTTWSSKITEILNVGVDQCRDSNRFDGHSRSWLASN